MRPTLGAAAAAAAFLVSIPLGALAQDASPGVPVGQPAGAPEYSHADVAGPGSAWPVDRRLQWVSQQLGQTSGYSAAPSRGQAQLAAIEREEARLKAAHGEGMTKADRNYLVQEIDSLCRELNLQGAPWAA